jgi:hypothetical protein
MVSYSKVRFVPALFAAALIAGCTSADPGAMFNSGANTQQPAIDPVTNAAVVQGACPTVELREGTAFYRTYEKGGDGDPSKVIHQASIADTTRQCVVNGGQITATVVASGRVVAGPAGKAGQVEVPVRVAVVDGENVLYSELQKQPVFLPENQPTTQFVFTNAAVTFPASASRSAKILIGFDPGPYNTP